MNVPTILDPTTAATHEANTTITRRLAPAVATTTTTEGTMTAVATGNTIEAMIAVATNAVMMTKGTELSCTTTLSGGQHIWGQHRKVMPSRLATVWAVICLLVFSVS